MKCASRLLEEEKAVKISCTMSDKSNHIADAFRASFPEVLIGIFCFHLKKLESAKDIFVRRPLKIHAEQQSLLPTMAWLTDLQSDEYFQESAHFQLIFFL